MPRKPKPRPDSITASAASQPESGMMSPYPRVKKVSPLLIDEKPEGQRLAAQTEMLSSSVLQQRETKYQRQPPTGRAGKSAREVRSSRENFHAGIGSECGGQVYARESMYAGRTRN